jgi:hypothetical protein
MEPHEKYQVMPGNDIQKEVEHLFGEQAYYVKVDKELPERTRPKWERKRQDNGGDD